MKTIDSILTSGKYTITWTISYIAIMWFILMFMFGFNIFSWRNWMLLTHAHISGFAGFVFCILLLAMIPLYIATTSIIIRTKQPLFTLNLGEKLARLTPPQINATPQQPAAQTTPTPESDTPQPIAYPDDMPTELRQAFDRARQKISAPQISAYNRPTPSTPIPADNTVNTPETADLDEFPLPSEFDFTDTEFDTGASFDVPTFTDITFGEPQNTDNDDTDTNTDPTKTTETTAPTTPITASSDSVIQYLQSHGRQTQSHNNMIISGNLIIATHDDPEFWIADPETWFAAGNQKPSPIIELIKASAQTGCKPVMYLAQTNIMDLENCRTEWENMGITVITDLAELPL